MKLRSFIFLYISVFSLVSCNNTKAFNIDNEISFISNNNLLIEGDISFNTTYSLNNNTYTTETYSYPISYRYSNDFIQVGDLLLANGRDVIYQNEKFKVPVQVENNRFLWNKYSEHFNPFSRFSCGDITSEGKILNLDNLYKFLYEILTLESQVYNDYIYSFYEFNTEPYFVINNNKISSLKVSYDEIHSLPNDININTTYNFNLNFTYNDLIENELSFKDAPILIDNNDERYINYKNEGFEELINFYNLKNYDYTFKYIKTKYYDKGDLFNLYIHTDDEYTYIKNLDTSEEVAFYNCYNFPLLIDLETNKITTNPFSYNNLIPNYESLFFRLPLSQIGKNTYTHDETGTYSFLNITPKNFIDEQDYLNFYQNSDLLPFYEKETPSYLKSNSISIIHKNNEEINAKIDRTYDTYEYEANFLTESLKENNPLLGVNIEF